MSRKRIISEKDEENEPEFGSRPEDLASFNYVVMSIPRHNRSVVLGELISRTVVDNNEQQEVALDFTEPGSGQVNTPARRPEPINTEEEHIISMVVGATNAPILKFTGLTVSPFLPTDTMFSKNGDELVGRVRLQVADGGKFSGFLSAIVPEDADETFRRSVTGVISSLNQGVAVAIATDTVDAVALEALAYGEGIVAGLERIGLADSPVAEKLRTLYEHAQQGDVREYVVADAIGLLEDPTDQSSGPATWHRDATPEGLASRWNQVLRVVKEARDNPNAQDLYDRLHGQSQNLLGFAQLDWAKVKEEYTNLDDVKAAAGGFTGGSNYGEGFEGIFEVVNLELGMLGPSEQN